MQKETGANIGKSIVIKGELSGDTDLYIDGQVDGTIDVGGHLMVGPNGRAQINASAKEVVILGSVKGKVCAVDRIEMRKTSSVMGEFVTKRFVIEDGAYFKGTIDMPQSDEHAADSRKLREGDSLQLGESLDT